jgi:phosphatidylglycerophosphatase C
MALFDLDGTITRRDTLLPFLAACLQGRPARRLRLLGALPGALARFVRHRDRGEFKGALIHAALGGLTHAEIDAVAARYVPRLLRHGVFAEALERIAAHRERGDALILLSASTDLYVPRIASALGFEECHCTAVRWNADGRLDGRLAGPNRRGEEKVRCLEALIERLRPGRVYAYGNSRSDLPHMRLADEAWFINGRRSALGAEAVPIRPLRWRE